MLISNLSYTHTGVPIGTIEFILIRSLYGGTRCHAPIPGPTRLADPNRVRGVRLKTGTLYLIFFFKIELVLVVMAHILYPKTTLHIQSAGPTVMNPYWFFGPAICGCLQMSSPVPTRIKNPC